MPDDLRPLLLDLVEWAAGQPRRYRDVMDAWRTSCPGLPVWEEAVDRGYLVRQRHQQIGAMVTVTPQGRRFLVEGGRMEDDGRAPARSSLH